MSLYGIKRIFFFEYSIPDDKLLILFGIILFVSLIFVIPLITTNNYDNFQEFAKDTSELYNYDDVVERFGKPSYDMDYSNYNYYTIIYNNIKVKKRGKKRSAFFKIDRQTNIIVGKGLE